MNTSSSGSPARIRKSTTGLRRRNVDVLTAYEDGAHQLADPALLDRAMRLRRVLFTQDDDLLREATRRQEANMEFAGVIYVHQNNLSIGQCIDELELIAAVFELVQHHSESDGCSLT